MEESQAKGTKLAIVSGKQAGAQLKYVSPVGYALLFPDCSYYIVKFWMFGGQSFYLNRTKTDPKRFTLYARKLVDSSGAVKLLNPVGVGVMNPELKDYLELKLKLPRRSVFIELAPSNQANVHELVDEPE